MPLEAWLRGPVDGVPPMLVPVAHMLQHAQDDAAAAVKDLTPDQIWARPGGRGVNRLPRPASHGRARPVVHVRAREHVERRPIAALKGEREAGSPQADAAMLTVELAVAIARGLDQLRATDPATLRRATRQWDVSSCHRRCWACWCTAANTPRDTRGRRLHYAESCWVLSARCGVRCRLPSARCAHRYGGRNCPKEGGTLVPPRVQFRLVQHCPARVGKAGMRWDRALTKRRVASSGGAVPAMPTRAEAGPADRRSNHEPPLVS